MIPREGKHIWLDSSKSGKGTGTESNPLPAKTAAMFDDALYRHREHTTIHLKNPERFYITNGVNHSTGIGVCIGSGCNITGPRGSTVKLALPDNANGKFSVIYSDGFTYGNIIEGITIDGGVTKRIDGLTVNAVNVRGNRSELRDLWVMQCCNGIEGNEGFPISIGDDAGPLISPIIENCTYWGPYFGSLSASRQATMFLISASNGLGVHGGVMRGNRAYLTATPGAYGNLFSISGANGCVIEDNVGWVAPNHDNSWVGIHQDTLNTDGLLVRNNTITAHVGWLYSNSCSWPSLNKSGPQIWRGINITDNRFFIHAIPGKCYGGQFINAGGEATKANRFVNCSDVFNEYFVQDPIPIIPNLENPPDGCNNIIG